VPITSSTDQTPVPFTSGSNPLLQPETSKSKTLGLVWSPSFIPNFNASLDWWKIRIDNTIVADSPNQILIDCYEQGVTSRCAQFTRVRCSCGYRRTTVRARPDRSTRPDAR